MPFVSEAQRKFMWARHPRLARKWSDEMDAEGKSQKNLPKKKTKSNPDKTFMRGVLDAIKGK